MKTDNLTAAEAELLLINGYKVQPMDISWKPKEYVYLNGLQLMVLASVDIKPREHHLNLSEWFCNYKGLFYRLVTTDEDVVKWRLLREAKNNPFDWSILNEPTKEIWRNGHAAYLTTLPELTEEASLESKALQDSIDSYSRSATVSDVPIKRWWKENLKSPERAKIVLEWTAWEYLTEQSKQLVRTAYHKAHEKVEQKVEAPQAYKFPYDKVAFENNRMLGINGDEIKPINFTDKGIKSFICEAINEKIKRETN